MTTARERILQKLNPKLLQMTPKLSAENGSFINLDSDDSLKEGAKELMMRFYRNQDLCEKNKQYTSQSDVEVVVTSMRYEGDEVCEILSERLKLSSSKNDINLCDKPGRNLQKLKLQLQEKMSAKWEEEYKKRVKENKVYSGNKESSHRHKKHLDRKSSCKNFDSNSCSEEDDTDEQESSEDDGCEGDVEDEEEEEVDNALENDAISCNEADDQPEGKKTLGEKPAKEMEFEDTESCSLPPPYQPGGGLLYGGSELTQCDEGLPQNLFSPSLKLIGSQSPQSKSMSDLTPSKKETISVGELSNSFSARNKLFSQNLNDSYDLNEAYEFCSGKFPDECSNSQFGSEPSNCVKADEAKVDNEDEDEEEEEDENEDEEEVDENKDDEEEDDNEDDEEEDDNEEVCDKSEDELDSNARKVSKVRKNIIMFDDSEDEEESNQPDVENSCETSKVLSDDEGGGNDRSMKRRKNLRFSDEEDEDGEKEEVEKDSESEESEKEMEKEEGDKDIEKEELEEEKDEERSVHYDSEENEIINPREFFEKEAELSGSEWSVDEDERGLDEFDAEEGDADNLDSDQVRSQLEKIHLRRILDEDAREVRLIQEILFEDGDLHSDGKGRERKFRWKNLGKAFEENGDAETKEEGRSSSEDEGAEEEQQRKLRHEKELFLMEKKRNGDENSDDEIVENFHCIKLTSLKNTAKVSGTENSRTALDCTEIGKQVTLMKARGSFLTRNEEFLSKLAKVTSSISDNVLGPKHSKNFVFASKSPEKMEPSKPVACKRQVDDAEILGKRHDKKFKLLSPDVDTGPSILDLLA